MLSNNTISNGDESYKQDILGEVNNLGWILIGILIYIFLLPTIIIIGILFNSFLTTLIVLYYNDSMILVIIHHTLHYFSYGIKKVKLALFFITRI